MILLIDIIYLINNYLDIINIIILLNTTKYYNNNKKEFLIENIINKYFKKNIIYYYNIYHYYDVLKNTDFNISLLENNDNINFKIYNISNISENTILSTFTTFKLSNIIYISNNINNINLSNQLIKYFDDIYNLKYLINNENINNETIYKFKTILNLNKDIWCCININLYNIYEIWKHIKYKNNKLFNYYFYNNIILNDNKKCIYKTLLFLLKLNVYFNDKKMKIYIIYHTFQYINNNILFINKIEELTNKIINKINEIKTEIIFKYYDIIPKKIIKKLIILFNDILNDINIKIK